MSRMSDFPGFEFMGENVKKRLKYCGEDVRIYPLCKMLNAENAMIDSHTRIMDNCWIDAGPLFMVGKHCMLTWGVIVEGQAEIRIGDRVFIGPGAKILSSTYKVHGYYTMEFLPEGCSEIEYGNITINDDAYIAANCAILPGVTVGEGAVLGANSLATKDLEPWGIYVGSPAKKIGMRERPSEEKRNLLKQYDWSNHLF